MTDSNKVYAAMASVMTALGKQGITKSRTNEQGGAKFKFRGIDEVMNTLNPLMAEAGLLVVPHYSNRTVTERATSSGGKLFCVVLEATYRLVCAEDGSSVEVGPVFGEAFDSGDKATNKAMSIALKYALLQTFMIPTEPAEGSHDPDAYTHKVAGLWDGVQSAFDECATLEEVEETRKSRWRVVKDLDGAREKFTAMSRGALARIKAEAEKRVDSEHAQMMKETVKELQQDGYVHERDGEG